MKAICKIEVFDDAGNLDCSVQVAATDSSGLTDDPTDIVGNSVRRVIDGLFEANGNTCRYDVLAIICDSDTDGPFGLMAKAYQAWLEADANSERVVLE